MGNAQEKPPESGGGGGLTGRAGQRAAGGGGGGGMGKPQDRGPPERGPVHGGESSPTADSRHLDAPAGALPPHLARLKNEGNHLFRHGQFGDAMERYSRAIEGFPGAGIDSPEDLCILYSNRAACHLKEGSSADCIQDCTKALELQPYSLKALLRRAMAYESLERYRKAYVDYKTVLQIDGGVQAAHDSVHRSQRQQSDLNAKVSVVPGITKMLMEQDGPGWREKLPEIPTVPLAVQQQHRQKPLSAEEAEARAARAAAGRRRKEARCTLLKAEGNDLVRRGCFQEALQKYGQCLTLKPQECALYTNRWDKRAATLPPGSSTHTCVCPRPRRAVCFLKLNRFEEAKQECDRALRLEPNNRKAFYRRALAHKGLQVPSARSNHTPPLVRSVLTRLLFRGQDYLSASSDLQEVLQLDPNVREAEQELETVTGLLR
ncbi:unnamed protein product, partial [Tetraodon nigroviridis]